MLSFNDYKKMANGISTVGQQLKFMSDEVMQETFDNDIQTRQCYIYDYYHDDQPDMEYGYNPSLSKTKIPVKLKFVIKTYKSMAKEDPEYHIMFEPDVWNSMSCKPDWFVNNYEKLGIKFPIGLYCDIPDDRGMYHKWLIMYHEVANQFPKFGVLRCNYLFKWIENDGVYRHKRKVWGVDSTQNSYTSGVWKDYKTQTFDDQDKFYLPWSPIVSELKHDMRLAISMLQKEPWTYQITKVHNTSPKGIVTFTVKQDRFEPEHDYVQLNPDADDYGDMYPDYYSDMHNEENDNCHIKPCDNDNFDCTDITYNKHILVIKSVNDNVKIGSSKVIYAKVYDAENKDITKYFINSECIWDIEHVENDLITDKKFWVEKDNNHNDTEEKYSFKCKFKFTGDERYMGYNINVTCKLEDLSSSISLNIVTL